MGQGNNRYINRFARMYSTYNKREETMLILQTENSVPQTLRCNDQNRKKK